MNKSIKIFFLLFCIFLSVCLVLIASHSHGDLHLLLTHGYNKLIPCVAVNDMFYRCITEVGGFIPFIIALVLLLIRLGDGVFFLASQLASSLLVNILKNLFNEPRPSTFFAETMPDVALHTIEGISLHATRSFPSGHTTAAFVTMFALAFIFRHKSAWWSVAFFTIAVLAGYSRVYLSQHFLEDVTFGAIIGVAIAGVCAWIYTKKDFKWYNISLYGMLMKKQ